MAVQDEPETIHAEVDPDLDADAGAPRKAMTIGAVCKALGQEFPDISISKIRYLEDQKLLEPRRTPGGYRLYAQSDVAPASDGPVAGTGAARRKRNPSVTAPSSGALYSLEDVIEETRAEPRLVAELEEYGVIKGDVRAGTKYYDETEREIVRAVTELARYGVGGRNLRAFRTSADREAALLQQILAPALRSRNAKRRKEAIEALENLAAVTTHLKHLLLIRDLRKIVS